MGEGNSADGRPGDVDLVARLARGDTWAFQMLFERHTGTIYRYAWGLSESPSDVDDLVQETFLVAWKRRGELSVVSDSVLPWLLATCRNVSLNLNRQRRRQETTELIEDPVRGPAWYQRRDREAALVELEWVLAEMTALPDLDRRLCELCLIEGRSYDEAAAFLGLTPANARKRIQRSRLRLRAARATD